MIDSIERPAIFIDTQYTILAVNEAYRGTYESEVVLGKSRCFEISHDHSSPCDKHGEDCPIQTCMSTQKSSNVMHVHNTEFGKTYCDILMKPVKDADGMVIGFLEILDKINFAAAEPQKNKMIGKSAPFKKMLTQINRAAKADIAVLLHGETGTGKELVARALHDSSERADKPFVVIECTGLNENLFESELFGHEKGAFTGATHSKKGLIEIANGGTVFFDEIADVALSMQVKLLRLIETQCYRTVGGLKQRKANFRLICASHKNLLTLVDEGLFRKDLYYRIAGFPINLPSLSQREEDIPALCKYFLSLTKQKTKRFSEDALTHLSRYSFPGNIRELKNIVEHAALLANEDIIEIADLPEHVLHSQHRLHNDNKDGMALAGNGHSPHTTTSEGSNNIKSLEQVEADYLRFLCENPSLTIDELANNLDLSTRTLYRKLQKYGLKYD
ncbi:sigma-54-dependent Fis family transcriptional regulator [Glaciecola sp. XM2]|nr:sigma-54-dependent Fis family transcriptional regulator [Glaciecola sp. XM2]